MTEDIGIGNELYRITRQALNLVFAQGELAQLSHSAFDYTAGMIKDGKEDVITIDVPIGYKPSKETMTTATVYKKDELVKKYEFLAFTQIPMNGIYQLAMVVEAMLTDLVRKIILRYPEKLGVKRQISLKTVLSAKSLPELHLVAADAFLNDLSYKSPRDFGIELMSILSVNVLECTAYHKYIEMKATRDILIHNQGIANETYVSKSASHARVRAGVSLPIDQVYFLESYEACLQLIEWIEVKLHDKWHSSEHAERLKERMSQKD